MKRTVMVNGKKKVFDSDARFPLGKDANGFPLCRCCGKPVRTWDGVPIHTKCIPKHWGKHARGVSCSRCLEFSYKANKGGR